MTVPSLPALPECLGGISADLRSVFGKRLHDYADRIRQFSTQIRRPKVINDPIWKTVRVEPWEAIVLDSPPVQRLRNVSQLGLAHLVYPGAGYSRFEHSIGVLYQAQRIIDSINRNARASGRGIDPILQADESLLRLAALLHDIGHGFLSHVSERAMSRIEQLPHGGSAADAQLEAKHYFRCRKLPAFSEVVASLIVLLPEFIEVLDASHVPKWSDPVTLAYHLAHLIVGSTPYFSRPFLSEIISGSVDADKLDYMTRDCFMAGLPMPVDVERLLQKLQAVAIPADSEQGEAWAEFAGLSPQDSIYVMAVDERGGIAAEELVVSRVLLYDKLYHHQKVRSFEGLAERAMDLLIAGSEKFKSPATYLELSDVDFLEQRWDLGAVNNSFIDRARELMRRIADRHEMVRAIAFGPTLIDVRVEDLPIAWKKLQPHVTRERTDLSMQFVRNVVEKAQQYLRCAGRADLADTLADDLVLVDLPDPQGISQKTQFFVGNEEIGLRLYSEVARVDRWAEAYEHDKTIGYVYCPPEHAVAVHLAVRQVIQSIAGITMDDRQITRTKLNTNEVAAFATLIRDRGAEVPDVRPVSTATSIATLANKSEVETAYEQIIRDLVLRFQTYQPYTGPGIDTSHITNFLLQFRRDDIPLVIKVLRNVEFWSRQRLADAFGSFLESLSQEHEHLQIVPLGGPSTSAHHLQYMFDDLRSAELPVNISIHSSIEHCEKGIPIVLIDDYVGSGGQSATVFMQWFGRPSDEWLVQEEHVSELSPKAKSTLSESPITCLFAAGRRDGLAKLTGIASALVGAAINAYIVLPSDVSCFRPASNVFDSVDEANRARSVFEKAGLRALSDEQWSAEKKAQRALGYGANADLNVFYYNTPSSTLTALWKRSENFDTPWSPLFLRRKRK